MLRRSDGRGSTARVAMLPYPCCMKSLVALVALALVGSLLLACGEEGPPEGAEIAPDVTVQDANGNAVTLSGLVEDGEGVILVFYRGFF